MSYWKEQNYFQALPTPINFLEFLRHVRPIGEPRSNRFPKFYEMLWVSLFVAYPSIRFILGGHKFPDLPRKICFLRRIGSSFFQLYDTRSSKASKNSASKSSHSVSKIHRTSHPLLKNSCFINSFFLWSSYISIAAAWPIWYLCFFDLLLVTRRIISQYFNATSLQPKRKITVDYSDFNAS